MSDYVGSRSHLVDVCSASAYEDIGISLSDIVDITVRSKQIDKPVISEARLWEVEIIRQYLDETRTSNETTARDIYNLLPLYLKKQVRGRANNDPFEDGGNRPFTGEIRRCTGPMSHFTTAHTNECIAYAIGIQDLYRGVAVTDLNVPNAPMALDVVAESVSYLGNGLGGRRNLWIALFERLELRLVNQIEEGLSNFVVGEKCLGEICKASHLQAMPQFFSEYRLLNHN